MWRGTPSDDWGDGWDLSVVVCGAGEGLIYSQFSIIDAGERLGLLGCGARGLARAAGIQNAKLEPGGSRVGHRNAELGLGSPRVGATDHNLIFRVRMRSKYPIIDENSSPSVARMKAKVFL